MDFVAELKTRAYFCEFGNFMDKFILDQFLFGLNNIEYQRQLLVLTRLTINLAIITVIYMDKTQDTRKR